MHLHAHGPFARRHHGFEIKVDGLAWTEHQIAAAGLAFGDDFETELHRITNTEKFLEMIEDQGVDIFDLQGHGGGAGTEFPIVGHPVHRCRWRMGLRQAQAVAELCRDVRSAGDDGVAILDRGGGDRPSALGLVAYDVGRYPKTIHAPGVRQERGIESLVTMNGNAAGTIGLEQGDNIADRLAYPGF